MRVPIARRIFTAEEYERMAQAGILHEDDRVELVDGEIVQMGPVSSEHAACVKRLNRWFSRHLGERALISVQDPIRIGEHSEPQPDLALLRVRADFYAQGHPKPEDVLLVVEVAESSAAYDREVKVPLYARAGIPEVWVVDLARRVIECYRHPTPQGYLEMRTCHAGHRLSPLAFPDVEFPCEEALG